MQETERPVKPKPTPRELLIDVLHDFLRQTREAVAKGEGLSFSCETGGVHIWSHTVTERALARIDGITRATDVAA